MSGTFLLDLRSFSLGGRSVKLEVVICLAIDGWQHDCVKPVPFRATVQGERLWPNAFVPQPPADPRIGFQP